jgi:hypothetical protein
MPLIGLVFQILGVAILLGSNLRFWFKARKVCGDVKRYSIYVAGAVLAGECEELKKMPEENLRRSGKGFHYLNGYTAHGGGAS